MDETKPPPPPPPSLPKRRRRKNSSDGGGVFDDGGKHQPKVEANSKNDTVVASLVLLGDEEDKKGQYRRDDDIEQRDIGDTHELHQIDQNHTQKKRHMMDYYSKLQEINRHGERETAELFQKAKSTATNGIVTAIAVGAATAHDSTSDEKSEKSPAPPQRRLWVKNRSKDWWDQCNSPDFPEEEFKKAFRMGKDTFDLICNELSSVVAKENTMLRDAVPVRQRVAVCVWRLATGEPLRLVSKKFGLGISTCHKLVLEVCSAIRNVLMPKYLRWPDEEGLRRIKEEFESMSGIPNVIGSMYTTHIPIIAPKNSVAAYFNRRHTERNQKTSYSITIQGVVDQRGIFTDVCIGYPGSLPDDQVLEKSTLFQRANTGFYQGIWIVGGSGYPLMDWVLVPYTHQHLTWTQHAFNEKIGEIHRVSKESFRRLKTRWGCLQKRTEVKLQDLPVVLGACCVLHNICELRNEDLDSTPKFELIDDEMFPEIGLRSANAMKARDTIAHNLLHHNHAGTSFLS